MRFCLIALFSACLLNVSAQDRELYIDMFKDIAIVEMHRTGIPASIKLAQGILESNAGASMLAERANNHFGIKCGSDWRGRTMMRKDDDRNASGKLVKSCFRAFESAKESYVAHSEFLRDPNKVHRYGPLFALASDDYRSWAYGLKKAGYATNPKYPQLLIKIIEGYELDKIDREALAMVAENTKVDSGKSKKKGKKSALPAIRSYPVAYINRVQTVVAVGGDSPHSLAEDLGMKSKQIVKYNESIGSAYETFEAGQVIYIQPKRSKFKGDQEFHIVKPGEDMLEIADKYGIKVSSLYKINRVIPGLQVAPGQRLSLRKKNKKTVQVMSRAHQDEVDPNEFIEEGFLDDIIPDHQTSTSDKDDAQPRQSISEPEAGQVSEVTYYEVQPQDTLYGIARRHGLTVEALKKMNNLDGSTIHPGQKIILDK